MKLLRFNSVFIILSAVIEFNIIYLQRIREKNKCPEIQDIYFFPSLSAFLLALIPAISASI